MHPWVEVTPVINHEPMGTRIVPSASALVGLATSPKVGALCFVMESDAVGGQFGFPTCGLVVSCGMVRSVTRTFQAQANTNWLLREMRDARSARECQEATDNEKNCITQR